DQAAQGERDEGERERGRRPARELEGDDRVQREERDQRAPPSGPQAAARQRAVERQHGGRPAQPAEQRPRGQRGGQRPDGGEGQQRQGGQGRRAEADRGELARLAVPDEVGARETLGGVG